jgi:hypothetical protein
VELSTPLIGISERAGVTGQPRERRLDEDHVRTGAPPAGWLVERRSCPGGPNEDCHGLERLVGLRRAGAMSETIGERIRRYVLDSSDEDLNVC